jgi:hypothetical protein
MAGLFETGGSIDSLFDAVRGELGKADTAIQAWFHDHNLGDTDRYNIQRVLFVYATGLKKGNYTVFKGYSDPQAEKIVSYVKANVSFDDTFIYNVIYALYDCSATDLACASVLAGSNGNVFDGLANSSVIDTITDTTNDALKGLGLPSLANTVVILLIVALIGAFVYFKYVRK